MWTQCFAKYTVTMAKKFPECIAGFISHMLTVFRAYREVEDRVWRLNDEAFRDKMASTGVRIWLGMEVKVYQEICGGRPRKGAGRPDAEGKMMSSSVGTKKPIAGRRPLVCWQFNKGVCSYGLKCKFAHVCETCQGQYSKKQCRTVGGQGKRQRLI